MKKIVVLLLLININFCVNAQQLITFPASDSIPHNDDFTVKVRIAGGQWQDLYEGLYVEGLIYKSLNEGVK